MSFAAVIERLQHPTNPYPGLRSFEADESHLFFGRDRQVGELVGRLEAHRFVAVVGVSGSGKSSLVRAGLIPSLARGSVLEAGRRWRMVLTRPGGAPFASLAADLATARLDASGIRRSSHGLLDVARQLAADESLLVVVDQFEELFRYKDLRVVGEDARRRHAEAAADAADFVQLLLAAGQGMPPVYVVLTMRSDYLGDCAEFRDLPETLNQCQYLIPRLTREQRKDAIECPLGRVEIAPAVVQRMLNDAGDEPDQLPVLQHALMRTWNHWKQSGDQTRRIELADYEAVGGFAGALDRHADHLLAVVSRQTAAAIFKRLTARGRGNRERRDPARLDELWAVCGAVTASERAQVTAVIDVFRKGEATFLSPLGSVLGPETYIDITHESLIRQWKTLRDEWLPEERRSAKTLIEVGDRARTWSDGQGELLAGLDLASVLAWDRLRNKTGAWGAHYVDAGSLTQVETFLAASVKRERARALRKVAGWSASVLLVVAVGGGWLYRWTKGVEHEIAVEKSARVEAEADSASAESWLATMQRAEPQGNGNPGPTAGAGGGANPAPIQPPEIPPPDPGPTQLPSVIGPGPAPGDDKGPGPNNDLGKVDPPPASGRGALPAGPRVYIQARSRGDAAQVVAVGQALRQAGFRVPAPEVLPVGPKTTEVRYFRQRERDGAVTVVRIVEQAGVPNVAAQYVPGHEDSSRIPPRHYELWLAADALLLPRLVAQLNDVSADARKAAGGQLARGYLRNPAAVAAVLDTLSEEHLRTLTTEGRINALYFLSRSDATAWTEETRRAARNAIDRLSGSASGKPGPQTMQEIDALARKIGR